ncbi:SDR family NAD(P)-dependent oxidoreductase [Blastococcus capsensis]|uniref:SDR family NAD(P)-dependent oxidoreductase n=1 Tax=Blastococcus capsensis TaxID=1564163 RepID=UPI00254046FC|nr:SDR family NAD(P)-dependent oxidoreductase [Blastococcus capsensis]MDK3257252.1 SDR family NAD(P)-dependent oxidoreductase [Blastococcus capsensis]
MPRAPAASRHPKVIVVTGASGGICRATAVAIARRGDAMALLARGERGLAAAADDVRAASGTSPVLPVGVSDAGAVEAAAGAALWRRA